MKNKMECSCLNEKNIYIKTHNLFKNTKEALISLDQLTDNDFGYLYSKFVCWAKILYCKNEESFLEPGISSVAVIGFFNVAISRIFMTFLHLKA